jgi:VWFA-related protein
MMHLRPLLRTALLVPFCAITASAQQELAPPSASFTGAVEVNVVNIEVYVTDRSGNRVAGLRDKDFQLLVDGKKVPISNFAAYEGSSVPAALKPAAPQEADAPAAGDTWNLVVFVDNSHISPANRARALRQVQGFLDSRLGPADRVMLVTEDLGLKVRVPFTADRTAVRSALTEMEGLAAQAPSIGRDRRRAFEEILAIQEAALNDPQPRACPLSIAQPAHEFAKARRGEVLRSLGGLTVLVNSLSGVPGRKAVLHVSDGIPATPGEEVFQFLAEICGGGGGTAGLGRQNPVDGPSNATEPEDPSDAPRAPSPGNSRIRESAPLDPLTVYDARMLGPGAYQAASQAPIDAASYQLTRELDALVAHANAQQVTFYTLQASGAERPEASEAGFGAGDRLLQFPSIEAAARASDQNTLNALATGTGGRAILGVNDFLPALGRMQEDVSNYYSLGFAPGGTGDGKEHRIKVQVKRPGVQVRYRESYRDKSLLEKAVDRTLAALLHGFEENPLAVSLSIGEQASALGGKIAVPVSLTIPLAKLSILDRGEMWEASLRLLVATGSAQGMSPVRQVAVPVRIPRKEVLRALGQSFVYTLTLELPAGEQRVAVGVRDEVAAATSYLSRSFNVGNPVAAAAPEPVN